MAGFSWPWRNVQNHRLWLWTQDEGSFMVKTASVFSRLETMEYLSGKRQGFTDKLLKINNLSGRRRGFTDESRNKNKVPCAEWADLLITDIGWPGIYSLSVERQGFTDKLFKIKTYPEERGVGSPGQTRTVVLRTNVALGLLTNAARIFQTHATWISQTPATWIFQMPATSQSNQNQERQSCIILKKVDS